MNALSWAWLIAGLCVLLLCLLGGILTGWYYRLNKLHQRTPTGRCALCAEPFPCITLQAIGVTHDNDTAA